MGDLAAAVDPDSELFKKNKAEEAVRRAEENERSREKWAEAERRRNDPNRIELPTAVEVLRLSDEEWADLRENVIYYYSRNEVEFIENQVEKMRKHHAQNTARANTVDLENRDRPEVPYVVKGLVPSGVPVWMVGVKMAGKTLSAIDLGCRLPRR